MTETPRRPLRPLARILRARDKGENPDLIERENLAERHNAMRDRSRRRAEGRILVVGLFFVAAFCTVGVRMSALSTSDPVEPRYSQGGAGITSARADIVDRNGRLLATNVVTQALYAHPNEMVDIPYAAAELGKIFPDIDADALATRLASGRKFVWIRRTLSPEQIQAVHDIGDPGLLFADRDLRLYPNGTLAAHILGGARYGREGVGAAELLGVAGIEKAFDDRLLDPAQHHEPLQLSIDLTVQSTMREVLDGGMRLLGAKGASGVLMDVNTGEIISMVSLPDFDPNHRPQPLVKGDQADSPLFNRAVQGVYELGSVFKIFAVAQAMEEGIVTPTTMVDTQGPMVKGRHKIRDFRNYGPRLSATDVIVKSSNIGTAHLALKIGGQAQREFLGSLGFLDPTPVELIEAPNAKPLLPRNWGEIQSMTISYGHGLSTSPVHLAAGYASLLNGGTKVEPTLLRQSGRTLGPRVVSEQTSKASRDMLRAVVTRGTASFGEVAGYAVGGKTGTADKPKPTGGYYKDRVLATFAGVFPAHDPRYVFVITMDEGHEIVNGKEMRTAGWTAVPVTAELIRRVAPLLGMRPDVESDLQSGLREARNGH
ncbi:peptidoglycan D,D-transpeptidase FtsI family protein [Meridianimarinicoccus aquatilis]|uniref:Penicillin-binding protein 2 n=1 Tax=Meridianimarinicoccus aquatilis TaxID=2552766 RepID=A0A4R6AQY4_9RHOB|nr:penicillin-binding protein 2 [Fluviibacterium aquatile]QIE41681.1 penicillin-binding protein 2 [Rhodobacteraceae bacterium SC52]TDL84456.1 penicillin-binding protein 2 [Fluviibacterium aquatile]